MSPISDPVDKQLDAVSILLANAELLPATLETELRLYGERLASARRCAPEKGSPTRPDRTLQFAGQSPATAARLTRAP